MKSSKTNAHKAAQEMADVFEAHFASLSPDERAKRERAVSEMVASIGSRAKSSAPVGPLVMKAPYLQHE